MPAKTKESASIQLIIEQAQNAEKKTDFLLASHSYTKALELAKKDNDSLNIKLCKQKLIETNKLSDKEFQNLSVEHKLSKEHIAELKRFTDSFAIDQIENSLYRIGLGRSFMPNYSEVETTAKETMPIARSLASVTTISPEGHMVRDGSDGPLSWVKEIYGINQMLILNLYLHPVMSALTLNKKMTAKTLMDYLKKQNIFSKQHINILQVGIERHFASDYLSALHILVPRFESIFIDISEKAGVDTITLKRDKKIVTEPSALSESFLNNQSCRKLWGADFCEQIKFILLDPLGYKIRHRIAHGKFTIEEAHSKISHLIIHLLLVVATRTHFKTAKK